MTLPSGVQSLTCVEEFTRAYNAGTIIVGLLACRLSFRGQDISQHMVNAALPTSLQSSCLQGGPKA